MPQFPASNVRLDIQFLRGYAVLLVVLYHAEFGVSGGYLGVDIFFVISGFLITKQIAERVLRGAFSFTEFYIRRAKRLLPAAYVTFAATSLLAALLLGSSERVAFSKQLIGSVSFVANIVLWGQSSYFDPAAEYKPLLHVWSLSIEEQFYFILPLALAFLPSRFWLRGLLAISCSSVAICFLLLYWNPSAAFFFLPSRAWELCIGSIAAITATSGIWKPLTRKLFWPSALGLAILPVYPTNQAHPGFSAILICSCTVIYLMAANEELLKHRVGELIAWIGDFSYSLYLVHWPIFAFTRVAWVGPIPFAIQLGLVALSCVAGFLLYRLVEKPFRHFRAGTEFRWVGTAALLMGSLGLVGFAFVLAMSSNQSNQEDPRRFNYGLSSKCEFTGTYNVRQECQSSSNPTVVFWGDSFAMHLVAGMAASKPNLGLLQATKSACPPILGLAPLSRKADSMYNRRWAVECLDFNDSVLSYLKSLPSGKTIVMSSSLGNSIVGGDDDWEILLFDQKVSKPSVGIAFEQLRKTVEMLRSYGHKVVFVGPPPRGDFDVGSCSDRRINGLKTFGPLADCRIDLNSSLAIHSRRLQLLNQLEMKRVAGVVNLYDFLCDEFHCISALDRQSVYRDADHLSVGGSIALFRAFGVADSILLRAY